MKNIIIHILYHQFSQSSYSFKPFFLAVKVFDHFLDGFMEELIEWKLKICSWKGLKMVCFLFGKVQTILVTLHFVFGKEILEFHLLGNKLVCK